MDHGVSNSPAPQEEDIGSSRETLTPVRSAHSDATLTPVRSAHSDATKIPLMLKRLLPYNKKGLNE